jgi:predicted ester cyclase
MYHYDDRMQGGNFMPLRQLAEKYMKALADARVHGKLNSLDKIETQDVKIHLIAPLPDITGINDHKLYIERMLKAYTDIKLEWEYVMSQGDIFAVHYTEQMKITGEIPSFPVPSKGKKVTTMITSICHVKNGKVDEVWMSGAFMLPI